MRCGVNLFERGGECHRIAGDFVNEESFEDLLDVRVFLFGRRGASIDPRAVIEPSALGRFL